MENLNMTLTKMEIQGLRGITESDYYDNGKDSRPWDFSVYEKCSFKGKTRSGVFSSLVQKGLVNIHDDEKKFFPTPMRMRDKQFTPISITEKGYQVLEEKGLINEMGEFIK